MIHHIGVDIAPGRFDDELAFWALLGFAEVPAPPTMGGRWRWVERDGVQLHLRPREGAETEPSPWHIAIVVAGHAAAVSALGAAGFSYEPGTAHWGAARGKTVSPGGVTVELMAAPVAAVR